MAGKLTLSPRPPFAYRAGATILHRAPAGIKFICVIVISAVCFTSVYGLGASILVILAASAAARILPWQLLRGSRLLALLSLFIVLMKTFFPLTPEIYHPGGLAEGLVTALRIFVPYAAAALLFAVTTMRSLRRSIAAVELALKKTFAPRGKKQGVAFFSLGLTLMLGFIPRFFDLWEASAIACDARSCKRGPRRLFLLIPLVTERMMESAADTALALQARGFNS